MPGTARPVVHPGASPSRLAASRRLAERLDRLFRTVHSKDRGPYTPAEVAEAINRTAGGKVVSGTYLWLLRTGQRGTRP